MKRQTRKCSIAISAACVCVMTGLAFIAQEPQRAGDPRANETNDKEVLAARDKLRNEGIAVQIEHPPHGRQEWSYSDPGKHTLKIMIDDEEVCRWDFDAANPPSRWDDNWPHWLIDIR